jgi:hypothetical protein
MKGLVVLKQRELVAWFGLSSLACHGVGTEYFFLARRSKEEARKGLRLS